MEQIGKYALRVTIDTPVPNVHRVSTREEIFEFDSISARNVFVERLNNLFEQQRKAKGPFAI